MGRRTPRLPALLVFVHVGRDLPDKVYTVYTVQRVKSGPGEAALVAG